MDLPDWIGQVILAGGGGAAAAFGLFKFLGQNWIKHQLSKDLEVAKAEISLLSSRRMKLHDKEYEVFPEIWSRLMRASQSLTASVYSFNQMPDFNRMNDEEIIKWAERNDLDEDEKEFLLKSDDRTTAFSRVLDFRKLRDAEKYFYEFKEFLQANRIFLSPDVKVKFDEIENKLRSSWAARKVDFDHRGGAGQQDFLLKAFDICEKEVKPLIGDIEAIVQKQLFPENETMDKGLKK